MHPLRLESDTLLAWVSPLAGGLVDLSQKSRQAPRTPVPLLRRSPPGLDHPSWLAFRPRLRGPLADSETSMWRLLDRTPLSVRLSHSAGDDASCTIRYELTPDALLIEFEADLPESASLAGAVLINGLREGVELEPRLGLGRVLLHDRHDAKLPINTNGDGANSFALVIRPGPPATNGARATP